MWLGKLKYKKVKKEKNAVKIQCMFRRYKAIAERKKLKIKRYYTIRENAANKIKAAYRRWKLKT